MKNQNIKKSIDLEIIFEANEITKKINNKTLLDNVSFKLFSKSFHVIIGHNGAGKSTLFNICTGNDKRYTGTILFKNNDITLIKSKKSFLYFDTNSLYPNWWNVMEYLENFFYFFKNKKISKLEILTKLKEYDLDNKIKFNPNNLSSGEKKKLSIILLELLKPELVFLDEPDSNLDMQSRRFIYEKLRTLANNGSSIFLSSHYNDEVKKYADRLTFIKNGKIVDYDYLTNNSVEIYEKTKI